MCMRFLLLSIVHVLLLGYVLLLDENIDVAEWAHSTLGIPDGSKSSHYLNYYLKLRWVK